jgi:hypothetical protein
MAPTEPADLGRDLVGQRDRDLHSICDTTEFVHADAAVDQQVPFAALLQLCEQIFADHGSVEIAVSGIR